MGEGLENQVQSEETAIQEKLDKTDRQNRARRMEQMRLAIKDNLTSQVLFMMNTCIHCGVCADACHYYRSTGDLDLIPAVKFEKLSNFLDQLRPSLFKTREALDEDRIAELFKTAYEDCTLCGKCALSCPMGINAGEILYLARAMLCSIGRPPSGLTGPVQTAFEAGNYLGLSTEDFVETIEWIAEELEDELGEENFSIPIDKEGAQVLYIPHPLEVRDLPFLVMYPVSILHAAGEDYTLSSYDFDPVNYAYYQGSKENMMRIARRMLDAREKIKAQSIAIAPCGHGYRVIRWESEKYLGKRHAFPVLTIIELIDRYIKDGRIKLQKDAIESPITYHDPCNIARRGGIVQPPRDILRALTSQYVEMHPHGALNYCCGGGGGLGASTDYAQKRIEMGKTKVEQIQRTGAKIVATGCFNCMTQIRDLIKAYDMGIEVKSIVELVAGSLIT